MLLPSCKLRHYNAPSWRDATSENINWIKPLFKCKQTIYYVIKYKDNIVVIYKTPEVPQHSGI